MFLQFSSSRDFQPRVVEGSDTVAVDCFGNTVIDQENMGTLVYTPDPGYKVRQLKRYLKNSIYIHIYIDKFIKLSTSLCLSIKVGVLSCRT